MTEFYVFMKNRFNELVRLGKATQFNNGCIYLQLDVVPKSGDLMLAPVQPKCEVVELKRVDSGPSCA